IGSTLKERSQAALSRGSTTRSEWLPDDPSAFEPIKPWKWPCFTRLDDSLNQSPPTNSAEEAKILTGMTQAVAIPVPDCFPDCLMNGYVLGYSTSLTLSEVTPLVA